MIETRAPSARSSIIERWTDVGTYVADGAIEAKPFAPEEEAEIFMAEKTDLWTTC
jgi:hypothetical protein